jgi:hypothetical protein
MKNKNILVEYKGGGFDGCFWQWNYFMFDNEGKFANLHSTGYRGVKNETEAIELMKRNDSYDGISIADLTNKNDIVSFVNSGNASLMSMLAENELLTAVLYGSCEECGEIHLVSEMNKEGYSGDGGLAISAKMLFCDSCLNPEGSLTYENTVIKLISSSYVNGRLTYVYKMFHNNELIFSGNDYSIGMTNNGILDHLMGLAGFLTLKPGDTDDEYFENYTPDQMEWALSSDCEELSGLVSAYENGDFDEYWEVEILDEYDTIFEVVSI